MKYLIYQYWDGILTSANKYGSEQMKAYADTIGADYLFEHNPQFFKDLGPYSPHLGILKIFLSDIFDSYDYVLFCDTDVFPIKNLSENIFTRYNDFDLGICEEWNQPELRLKHKGPIDNEHDEKWIQILEKTYDFKYPRTKQGLPRVFNTGVVLFSRDGILKLRKNHLDIKVYQALLKSLPDFYNCDQPYLNFLLEYIPLKWIVMDYKWNSSVHYTPGTYGQNRPITDLRNNPYFVHIQLRGADLFNSNTIDRIVNLPVEMWGTLE